MRWAQPADEHYHEKTNKQNNISIEEEHVYEKIKHLPHKDKRQQLPLPIKTEFKRFYQVNLAFLLHPILWLACLASQDRTRNVVLFTLQFFPPFFKKKQLSAFKWDTFM